MIRERTLIPVSLRPFRNEDRAMILGTWIPAYWRGASCPLGWCSLQTFSVLYQPVVERLIRDSFIRVAVAPSDDNLILGYAVVQDDLVHWCHVTPMYREHKMLWFLIDDICDKPMRYSHETLSWRRHVAPKLPTWKYAPEAIRGLVKG